MKLVLCTGIFYMAYMFWGSVYGQYFDDPTLYFQKFEFDTANRGTFNISKCATDLMNCFELVKPDVICSYWVYYDTVCGLKASVCHDYYYYYDTYNWRFTNNEDQCKSDHAEQYT